MEWQLSHPGNLINSIIGFTTQTMSGFVTCVLILWRVTFVSNRLRFPPCSITFLHRQKSRGIVELWLAQYREDCKTCYPLARSNHCKSWLHAHPHHQFGRSQPSRHMEDTICRIAVDIVDIARDIVHLLGHLLANFQFSHYLWKTTNIYRHYEGQLGGSI